ncbi:MAG: amino acid ABC transporter permease [Burkholderiaceae bacterium]|nr:amino acid ABC transporter permease [Aquabacterium sp.]MCK6432220.1 amino acid ABC transporter permease [Aquabacterium sp.]NUP85407.1 amino acid ABC transporter permease [Burkholderiaceae bacterium]
MDRLLRVWPAAWSRQQRSSATMLAASVLLVLILWLIAIPLSWAPEPIGNNAQLFAQGTRVTVELTVVSGLAGVLLGMLAALGKVSRLPPLRWLAGFYIWVMRGTPLLVQVLFVYFALPEVVPVLRMDEFTAACVALALNVGAYNAEAIRSGLLAVPRGQVEAAHSLGLGRWHTFADVVFPQAFKIALPPLVNNIVALLKDSSLAFTIGVVELTNAGSQVKSTSFQAVPVFIATAIIYLVLTTVMTQISNAVERRFDIEGKLA